MKLFSNFQVFQIFYLFVCLVEMLNAQKPSSIATTALKMHNKYREKHQAKKLTPSDSLNNVAAQCAQYYAYRGVIDYSCPYAEDFGENLYIGDAQTEEKDLIQDAYEEWYSESEDYKYNSTQVQEDQDADHFTQMVWGETRVFGFGMFTGSHNKVLVALYHPPGNTEGDYKKNVKPTRPPWSLSSILKG